MNCIGIVVIGRNEGERLQKCLDSVLAPGRLVVYADSGSTDGSVEMARSKGAEVVELDRGAPFTAARGRNEGFQRLTQLDPSVRFVQFVDGDCEIHPRWLEQAVAALQADERIAVVCGCLREKHRDSSVYARLCDMEWNGPVGEIRSSGGIAMIRASVFQQAGGFTANLAAGEEAELCERLRDAGYRIMRIPSEMGKHDAGITRFSQWWKRAARADHGFVKPTAGDPRRMRRFLSAVFWAAVLPVTAITAAGAAYWSPVALALLTLVALAYGVLMIRIYRHRRMRGDQPEDARLYSLFCVISKWPQLCGQIRFWLKQRSSSQ